jgi:Permuted papain-like amidase enzyme, YaeF/YiiX, C92 family
VLLRHRDRELAARAALLIHDRVQASRKLFGRWIPYDFSMQLDEDDQLFCSKLVREAYRAASKGTVNVPTFGTKLTMQNRDFFDRLGVTAVATFAPADMEVEPEFDIVAEWRDFRVTPEIRMQDLLMSKLFEWMDTQGYVFRESLGIGLIAIGGRLTAYLPNVVKNGLMRLGVPKVPSNMTARTISTIAMLHKTAEPILQKLLALEQQHIATTGRPLHPRQVQAELERFRGAAGGRIGFLRVQS